VTSLVTGEETVLDADVVVFATGYSPADPSDSSARSRTTACATTRAASASSATTAS
jgi:lysine/ornithine N-monooxygenase